MCCETWQQKVSSVYIMGKSDETDLYYLLCCRSFDVVQCGVVVAHSAGMPVLQLLTLSLLHSHLLLHALQSAVQKETFL